MDRLLLIILITAAAGIIGTGSGAAAATLIRKENKITISLLLCFSAGIMISLVCFDLLVEAINPDGLDRPINIFFVIFSLLVGYLIVYIINAVHGTHTHTDCCECCHEHTEHKSMILSGVIMIIAIALHNLPVGMIIGASLAIGETTELSHDGIIMAVVIGLHNIPEGMAAATPLIAGGMKRWKAVVLTAASSLPTIFGAIIGYYIGTIGPVALSFSLGVASGAMLYVIFGELLPEANKQWQSPFTTLSVFVGISVGLIMLFT